MVGDRVRGWAADVEGVGGRDRHQWSVVESHNRCEVLNEALLGSNVVFRVQKLGHSYPRYTNEDVKRRSREPLSCF